MFPDETPPLVALLATTLVTVSVVAGVAAGTQLDSAASTEGRFDGTARTAGSAFASVDAMQQDNQSEPTVEFVDCNTVRIEGEAPEVEMGTTYYLSDGVSSDILEYRGLNGTTTLSPTEYYEGDSVGGEFMITDVTVFSEDLSEVLADKENPNMEACGEQIKPAMVDVSFVGAEQTGDGTYEVTFEYTNSNEAVVGLSNRIVAGTVNDEFPVDSFEPGTHQVTVTWTPQSDDERVVWEVSGSGFGLPDRNASSGPASQYDESTQTEESTTSADEPETTSTTTESGSNDDRSTDSSDGDRSDASSDDDSTGDTSSSESNDQQPSNDDSTDASDDEPAGDTSNAGTTERAADTSGEGSADASGGVTSTSTETTTESPTSETTTETPTPTSSIQDGTTVFETDFEGGESGANSPGQSGLGVVAALLALVAVALLAVRR